MKKIACMSQEGCLQQGGVVFESNLKKVATDGINDRREYFLV